jgi:tetratricopeptide (TPR) repeat protein
MSFRIHPEMSPGSGVQLGHPRTRPRLVASRVPPFLGPSGPRSSVSVSGYDDVGSFLDRIGSYDRSGNYNRGVKEIESYLSARLEEEGESGVGAGKDAPLGDLRAKAKVMLTLANLYLKQGDGRRGVKTLRALSEIAPDDPTVWCVWGRHEWSQGRYRSAKEKFEHGISLKPHSALLVAYATMEAQRRNRTKARSLLKQAVDVGGSHNPHAWVSYAQLEGRVGNPRKAVRICHQGLEHFPRNTYLWCTLGTVYENSGDNDNARDAFQRAMEIDPRNTFAIHELGKLASKIGDIVAARRYFQLGVDSSDPKGVLLCGESLCNVLAFQGDEEKARALFEQISQRFDGVTNSRFLRAWASFEKKAGNADRASELFSASAKSNPRDERTWLQWAQLERRRNKTKALECVRAGIHVSPLNPFLWQLYGSLSWEVEGAERGRDVFTKGVKSCSRNQPLLMAWAIMELNSGNQTEALDVLRRGDVSEKGRHDPLLELWARIAESVGEHDEAARVNAKR